MMRLAYLASTFGLLVGCSDPARSEGPDGGSGDPDAVTIASGALLDLTPVNREYDGTLSATRDLHQFDDGVRQGLDGDPRAYGHVLPGQLDGDVVIATAPYNTQVATPPRYCKFDVATGDLSLTFGGSGSGCAEAPFAYYSTAGIAKVPDGYRALVSRNCTNGCTTEQESFGLVKFSSNGIVDPTFGTDGILYSTVLPEISALAFAAQSTGNLVITGYTGLYSMKVFRIHADGSLDTTFATDGFVPDANGGRIRTLPDDTILLQSTYNGIERIERYTADGQPLPGFGTAGRVDLEELTISGFDNDLNLLAADVDASGRIVLGYRRRDVEDGPIRHFIMRLTATGALDATFGQGGIVGTFGDQSLTDLTGLGFDASGRIVFGARVEGALHLGHLAP